VFRERHDPFADADQPQSAAFRGHAILGGSTSIVLDRQRQPAPLRGGVLAGVLTEAESDTGLARIARAVDVGQALLDDAIDVRRRRRRQARRSPSISSEIFNWVWLPFLIPGQRRKAGGEPESIDSGGRSVRNVVRRALITAIESCERLFASGTSAGHCVSAVALN